MARFLVLWRVNWSAPWPTDPSKNLQLNERMWTGIDALMKKGVVEEYGIFPDGASGFAIGKGEATDVFSAVSMFQPYVICEVHEIISHEKSREIMRGLMKTLIAAAKK